MRGISSRAARAVRFRMEMRAASRVGHVAPKSRARGRALLSYLVQGLGWGDGDARFNGHTNLWESRQIARELAALGFAVDVVDYRNRGFQPRGSYDLVLGIDSHAAALADAVRAEVLLLHLTGSYPPFQNQAELRQLRALEARRGAVCVPRRQVEDVDDFVGALFESDACSLLGNEITLNTYPETLHSKITCLPVSASNLGHARPSPASGGYLWFFGHGAIHKGLDVTLEAFAQRSDVVLHVVGPILDEPDVLEAYRAELTGCPNIRVHGFLDPASERFASVVSGCFALVAPSCSESLSTAVATALHVGLIPLVTRQTGVSLPPGVGYYLSSATVENVVKSIEYAQSLTPRAIAEQSAASRALAQATYTRDRFAAEMRSYLAAAVSA